MKINNIEQSIHDRIISNLEYWLETEYPTTIIADRYDGTYSHGGWLAFPLYEIPSEVDGGDVECIEFWQNYKYPVGKGNTPNNALDNLRLKIRQELNIDEPTEEELLKSL